ncbi:flotillin domain protein [Aspergillus novofumigatus IBT 16806]|uniref:Flotillin domain-containing protein n=1 Tax=Aspergillus novofumigatus (strain IBT 16806) TaxID=1392255 RepID=A0A2I1CLZ2_ASPN1|nr:flotillin domain-containing protein [Aspergillus novofumigatus IBT 16806]PKX98648.1 flotillin domain-containing protein [Aspergillus novofumigatus IBT 16806]
MRYAISRPSEYLVLTGAGIDDIRICKKAIVMPWQRLTSRSTIKCARISVAPFDFSLNLQAMTTEKLQFSLPAVFTIGPDNEADALKKYALLLSGSTSEADFAKAKDLTDPTRRGHVQDIVKGIIEGETRVIVSSMTMEEIFKERQVFKTKVIRNVQSELQQFGLKIYNANVKELQDTPGSEYFAFLSRKAHEGALNQAKIDVAEARMRGEIGEAEKKGRAKQEISKIDADTAVLETKRKAEKAKADSELMNQMRDAELQKQVESKRAETELERLRAVEVTKSKVARESAQENADASFYTEQKAADAQLYRRKMEADATYYRQSKETDAAFYQQKREAEGILEMAKAYGALVEVLGGPQAFLQYRMLETGTYEKLAQANGLAIQGLNPRITTWNTGNGSSSNDAMGPIRDIMQSLPPLFSTIHEQTGISPPTWLAQMPSVQQTSHAAVPRIYSQFHHDIMNPQALEGPSLNVYQPVIVQ